MSKLLTGLPSAIKLIGKNLRELHEGQQALREENQMLREMLMKTADMSGDTSNRVNSLYEKVRQLSSGPQLLASGTIQNSQDLQLVLPADRDTLYLTIESLMVSGSGDFFNLTALVESLMYPETIEELDSTSDYRLQGGVPVPHFSSVYIQQGTEYSLCYKITNARGVLRPTAEISDLSTVPTFLRTESPVSMLSRVPIYGLRLEPSIVSNHIINGVWSLYG